MLKERIKQVFFIVLSLFSVIVINLIRIQVINQSYWRKAAARQYSVPLEIEGNRGKIISADAVELAYNVPCYDLYVNPQNIPNIEAFSKILNEILITTNVNFELKLKEKKTKKIHNFKLYEGINQVSKDKIIEKIKDDKALKGAVCFRAACKRFYSKGGSLPSLLGYVNKENVGKYGIESSFEEYLKPEKLSKVMYVSATNRDLEILLNKHESLLDVPMNGNNVILTIDSILQHILDEEITNSLIKDMAKSVSAVILDPRNGKILAMSSLPVSDKRQYIKNTAIADFCEPGSSIKPIIVAIALDSNSIDTNFSCYSQGQIAVWNRIVKDHDGSAVGLINLDKILTHSSNVGMVKIGERIPADVLYSYLINFGFGARTGIELKGEAKGILNSVKSWSGVSKAYMSHGYGFTATPLQIATAFAALVNGGNLFKPSVVDRIEDEYGNIIKSFTPIFLRKVVKEETTRILKEKMKKIVDQGTASLTKIEGFSIGGKTGTTKKNKNGIYLKLYSPSFIGFFPDDEKQVPKFLGFILVDEPRAGRYYSNSVVVPVFKKVIERYINYTKALPDDLDKRIKVLKED